MFRGAEVCFWHRVLCFYCYCFFKHFRLTYKVMDFIMGIAIWTSRLVWNFLYNLAGLELMSFLPLPPEWCYGHGHVPTHLVQCCLLSVKYQWYLIVPVSHCRLSMGPLAITTGYQSPLEILPKPPIETEQPHIHWALPCSYMTLWLTSSSSSQSPPITLESLLLIKQVMPWTPKLWQEDKVSLIREAAVKCLSGELTGGSQYTVEPTAEGIRIPRRMIWTGKISSHYLMGAQFKAYTLFISIIFLIIFSDDGWLQGADTTWSKNGEDYTPQRSKNVSTLFLIYCMGGKKRHPMACCLDFLAILWKLFNPFFSQ